MSSIDGSNGQERCPTIMDKLPPFCALTDSPPFTLIAIFHLKTCQRCKKSKVLTVRRSQTGTSKTLAPLAFIPVDGPAPRHR